MPNAPAWRPPFRPERRACFRCRADFTARRRDEVFCSAACGLADRARQARRAADRATDARLSGPDGDATLRDAAVRAGRRAGNALVVARRAAAKARRQAQRVAAAYVGPAGVPLVDGARDGNGGAW